MACNIQHLEQFITDQAYTRFNFFNFENETFLL